MLWYLGKLLKSKGVFFGDKLLLILNQRKYAIQHKLLGFKEKEMAQAKTLTDKELRQVLQYITYHKHSARNRAMLLVTHWSGMRVGEVAALRVGDVLAEDGTVRGEVRLKPEQTKGKHARTVYLPEKLRKELGSYLAMVTKADPAKRLFGTQKRDHFSASTLTQHFHYLYKRAGIYGASSHSGRRSFATRMAQAGIGIRVLKDLLGHRNISTTAAYIDCNDDMKRRAVELI